MRPMRTRVYLIMHARPMTQVRVPWIHVHACTCTCVHNYTHGICTESLTFEQSILKKTAFLFYYPCNAEAVGISCCTCIRARSEIRLHRHTHTHRPSTVTLAAHARRGLIMLNTLNVLAVVQYHSTEDKGIYMYIHVPSDICFQS